jgi:AcrR family transcriptional regulator
MAGMLDAGPALGEDELLDRVTAAALDQFADFGIRRSTIDDVARRAGVSRVSVFRRVASKRGLVEIVIAREIRRGMTELDAAWERGQSLEERLVLGLSFAVRYVSGHPLFDRLLRSEPEFLLPLLTVDGGPVLALYRSLIADRLRVEIRAGRAATADVDVAAEVIARLALSLLLTRQGEITLDDNDSVLALVRLVLEPMLRPSAKGA